MVMAQIKKRKRSRGTRDFRVSREIVAPVSSTTTTKQEEERSRENVAMKTTANDNMKHEDIE
jgi:hypothetical protein